jgi:hypothetical protein
MTHYSDGGCLEDWLAWAEHVAVRRLRDDVEWALALEETDPVTFVQSGGLPPEARGERGRQDVERDPATGDGALDREIGAPPRDAGGSPSPSLTGKSVHRRGMPRRPARCASSSPPTSSACGSDVLENRVTLCAFHHLRGVHTGRLRCLGRASDRLAWQVGIRPGAAPLVAYRSGDLETSP